MKKPSAFGKYLLLERINVGGMAEVFLAKAFGVEGFERILAIKRILPTMVEDHEFITMFLDEARISVQLNHSNIVQINELGKHDDSYYIAMEYVSGKDLRQLFDRYRKRKEMMPPAQAVFIASRMCEGLDYAHRKKDARGADLNIVHRDVSPQNILLSYEGEVKIIDFGIAKAANRAQKTQAGILKGKFGYMSPEQVRGMPIDRRSDLFAVGVILYELLTGERLFVGESDFSTLEKVRSAEVLPPRQYNSDIPVGLERVVMRALAREPDDRYPWCSDMQEDLLRYLVTEDTVYSTTQFTRYMQEAFADDHGRERDRLQRYAAVSRPDNVPLSGVTTNLNLQTLPPVLVDPTRPAPPTNPELVVLASGNSTVSLGPTIPPPTEAELAQFQAPDRTEIYRPSFHGPGVADPQASGSGATPGGEIRPPARPGNGASSGSEMSVTEAPLRRQDGHTTDPARVAPQFDDPLPAAPPGSENETRILMEPAKPPPPALRSTIPEERVAWKQKPPAERPTRSAFGRKLLLFGSLALLTFGLAALFALTLVHPDARLTVVVEPGESAALWVDDRPAKNHGTLVVSPGEHQVAARAPGFRPLSKPVTVKAGGSVTARLILVAESPEPVKASEPTKAPAPPAPDEPKSRAPSPTAQTPPRPASPAAFDLKVESSPAAAEIDLNGRRMGRTPKVLRDLDPAAVTWVRLSLKGYVPATAPVDGTGRREVSVNVHLEKADRPVEPAPRQVDPPGEAKAQVEKPVRPKVAAAEKTSAVAERVDKSMERPEKLKPGEQRGRFLTSSTPTAQVIVDDKETGRWTPITAAAPLDLSVGEHVVTYTAADGRKATRKVVVVAGETVKVVGVEDFQ